MRQKGFVHILLLVFIVVIGVGTLGYYSWKMGLIKNKFREPPALTPTTTSIVTDTSDWKIFTYSICGSERPPMTFTLKLPPDWTFVSNNNGLYFTSYLFQGGKEESLEISCGNGFGGGCDEKYKTEYKIGTRTIIGCYNQGTSANGNLWATYLTTPKGTTVSFSGKVIDKVLLDKILSTFKFIE